MAIVPLSFARSEGTDPEFSDRYSALLLNVYADEPAVTGAESREFSIRSVSGIRQLVEAPAPVLAMHLFTSNDSMGRYRNTPMVWTSEGVHELQNGPAGWQLVQRAAFSPDEIPPRSLVVADNNRAMLAVDNNTGGAWLFQPGQQTDSLRRYQPRYRAPDAPHAFFGSEFASPTYMASRFVTARSGSSRFYYSGIQDRSDNSPTSLNPGHAQFLIGYEKDANIEAGNLVGLVQNSSYLFALKRTGIDLWFPSAGDIFSPLPGGSIRRGVMGRNAFTTLYNRLYWLALDGSLWSAHSSQGTNLTKSALAASIRRAIGGTDPNLVSVFSYTENAKGFVVVQPSPDSGPTFVFDASSGFWHTREDEQPGDPWPCDGVLDAGPAVLCWRGRRIGEITEETTQAWGRTIRRKLRSNPVNLQNRLVGARWARFYLNRPQRRSAGAQPMRVMVRAIPLYGAPQAGVEFEVVSGNMDARARNVANLLQAGVTLAFELSTDHPTEPFALHEAYLELAVGVP